MNFPFPLPAHKLIQDVYCFYHIIANILKHTNAL